jgi:predicted ATPase
MLRRLRLEAGLSQEALAERARMSVDAISALERGTRKSPQRQTLALLVDGLQLDAVTRAQFEAAAARPAVARRADVERAPAAAATATLKRNHNLPFALTSFVGREAERAALVERLAAERLLTLAGTGGVGKTRLALELGHAVSDRFADGVWLIELAEIRDPALIVPAICGVLRVREQPGTPLLDTLVAALEASEHLLILDNCEHLLAMVAPLVRTLLGASERLRVLVTSREPLRVLGERVHRVAPLEVATDSGRHESSAVRLFVDRARAVDLDFRVDEESLGAVQTIVERLDGLPLAIELAAARVQAYSVASIAERVHRRLSLLTARSQSAIPHQVTMRALIDWSFDQLDPVQQVLFRRLAVFSGGWTLEAVETLIADGELHEIDAFEQLNDLTDKSMIVAEPARGRFRMLETIREYALEKLDAAGEQERYADRHAAYFLDLAARAGKTLRGPEQPESFAAIAAEIGNVRGALDRADFQKEAALRALAAMLEYWFLAGDYAEGRARIAAIDALDLAPSLWLAAVYYGATQIALSESAFDDARRFAAAGAAANADVRDALLAESIAATALLADVLDGVSVSPERLAEMRERAAALGQPSVAEWVATAHGFAAIGRGDSAAAQAYFEEALEHARASGDPTAVAGATLVLGRMSLLASDPMRAARLLADVAPVLAAREHLTAFASALDGLVVVAVAAGDHAAAARFLGAARRMHRVSGTSAIGAKAPPIPEDVTVAVRSQLGEVVYEELVAEGERAHGGDIVATVRAFTLTLV